MENNRQHLGKRDLLLLLVWSIVGLILRFTNLADKPPSSIEIATLGFSLGHGFSQIPLDEIISASTLLSPLKVDSAIATANVIARLLGESTHPPLYFCLTHWWTNWFGSDGQLISLQVGRSLSAILGALAIPAIFGLSWLAWRDRSISHFAAILMAVSPYGIYLAQEARHYTLSILWIIASLSCAIVAIDRLNHQRRISRWICLVWIIVNSLGIATHYFFALALATEGAIFFGFWWWNRIKNPLPLKAWLPIVSVGLGSLIGCLVWLPVASGISGNELTDWIETDYDLNEIWLPVPRLLAWLITMVVLLPVEGTPIPLTIASSCILLGTLVWIMPKLIQTWQTLNTTQNLALKLLSGYCLGAIVIYLGLIYGYGKDVSLAARYHFVYFPGILLLLAAILARLWQQKTKTRIVTIILLLSFLGSLTVISDYGFRKSRRANYLAEHIHKLTHVPTIVATSYETHSQLRELIALGYALETNFSSPDPISPQFLLLQRNDASHALLNQILSEQAKPVNLWGINLKASEDTLNQVGCLEDSAARLSDSGYQNRLYRCLN